MVLVKSKVYRARKEESKAARGYYYYILIQRLNKAQD